MSLPLVLLLVALQVICWNVLPGSCFYNIFENQRHVLEKKYGAFSTDERLRLRKVSLDMFYFGYNNYMKYAYPMDELNPILCSGRGPDVDDPSNVNVNDALGDYSLTLIDSLDTLAVIGDIEEFQNAIKLVVDNVSFDKDSIVQVFEANIRILGALLSAHLLMVEDSQPLGNLKPDWYDRQLLDMAADLASRLLPAFEESTTGLPHPRVNLRDGIPVNWRTDTCTAGAGSLLVEFGMLSRLIGDPVYEMAARRANKVLWNMRHQKTGLFGNLVDIETGKWLSQLSGVGAGSDSFYEYLLKSYIMFGEADDYAMFNQTYSIIKQYMRRGRTHCNSGFGDHPLYVNVDMRSGDTHTNWIDSLQAAFAGVQVLSGDIEEAICSHALYYTIWRKYGVLPERFNWKKVSPDVLFYPLRPEFVESTYLLYQATKNPFYLHVGRDILDSLNNLTRVECGYATVHSVLDKTLEDRMESFFLSETCKYLFLLFDINNPVNRDSGRFVFTTEGHVIPLGAWIRSTMWDATHFQMRSTTETPKLNSTGGSCEAVDSERTFGLPLKSRYLDQISSAFGVEF